MQRTHTNARALTLSLAATTAMWLFTYIALLFSGQAGGEALFILAALCIPYCAMIAARHGGSKKEGAFIGLLSAILNLLLVGSIVGGKAPREMALAGALWVGGLVVVSIVLGLIGASIGRGMKSSSKSINWEFVLFVVASALVFLMLVTGGLVTGMEAGLAVPDWPNSYGHNMLLYPLTEMISPENKDVFFEHAHRLTGMFVGLTSLLMVVCVLKWSRSRAVQVLAIVVFLFVCFQGLLGGLRVTGYLTLSQDREMLSPNLWIGVIHGVVGQLIFAGFVWIAATMSPSWQTPQQLCSKKDQRWAALLVSSMIVQLILGAVYRHMIGDVDLAPRATHILYTHIVMAVVVLIFAVMLGLKLMNRENVLLRRCGQSVLLLVGVQLLLGGGALIAVLIREEGVIPMYEILLTTAHQANGALLLGISFLALAWTRRMKCV